MKLYTLSQLLIIMLFSTTTLAQKKDSIGTKVRKDTTSKFSTTEVVPIGSRLLNVALTTNQWNILIGALEQADIKNLDLKRIKTWFIPQLQEQVDSLNKIK